MSEFALLKKYFLNRGPKQSTVLLGSGDDCALLSVPVGQVLAVSIDTLVAGVHFPITTQPEDIAYKTIAVGLSDLAAMGATPAWVTLALTLPEAQTTWLEAFSRGLFEILAAYGVELIGGDLTQGASLSLTAQLHGFVPPEVALKRSGAKPGDGLFVSGKLGGAGLALRSLAGQVALLPNIAQEALDCLYRPEPRVALGLALRGVAHSAIDISDGLLADLGHILSASGVSADIDLSRLPLHASLQQAGLDELIQWELASSAGDDYELCFTADLSLGSRLATLPTPVTRIGTIKEGMGVRLYDRAGHVVLLSQTGYEHFKNHYDKN